MLGKVKSLSSIRMLSLLLLAVSLCLGHTGCGRQPTPEAALATVARDVESPENQPASIPTASPSIKRPDPSFTSAPQQPVATHTLRPVATRTPQPTITRTPQPTSTRTHVSRTPVPVPLEAFDSVNTPTMSPGASGEELAELVGGNNAFAFDLYRALAQGQRNLFYSPYSVSLALAMAFAGAGGETERQMADTLRFLLPQDRLHPAFNALNLALASQGRGMASQDDSGLRLNIANAVWGQDSHEFKAASLDVLAKHYGSEIRRVDFRRAPEEARTNINDWVAHETENRIKDLITPGAIEPTKGLLLTNAIYFKAAWQLPFDERATTPGPFHPLEGGYIETPMMRQEGKLAYTGGDGYQAVELPYDGGEVVMAILLPDTGRFREFEDLLDASMVDGIIDNLEFRRVFLAMPKFEVKASFALADTLEAMGMPNAFDERTADFSGMDGMSCLAGDDGCLLITDVVHQAFVSVDETGTEAAAVTAVLAETKSADPHGPVRLTVDRPFIFLVHDRQTGTILLVGRVSEVRQSQ